MNWPFLGPASSSGGIGIIAFILNDPRPSLDDRTVLWSDARVPVNGIGSGSGSSFISAELPHDFLLTMEPNVTYSIWVWCFGVGHMLFDDAHMSLSMSTIECQMPFIVVDAGPPIHIG